MTPLIATILLVAFSVAAPTGLVFMAWFTRGPVERVRKSPRRAAAGRPDAPAWPVSKGSLTG